MGTAYNNSVHQNNVNKSSTYKSNTNKSYTYKSSIDNSNKATETFYGDGQKATGETTGTKTSETKKPFGTSFTKEEMLEQLKRHQEEIAEKLKNGETETAYQIGGKAYTEEEWDKLLDDVDEALDALTSESTSCISDEEGEKGVMYVTCYTAEGITCKKFGDGIGSPYCWEIKFTDKSQYDQVMDFLARFDSKANLTFASKQSFWLDFLAGKISEEEIAQMEQDYAVD